MPGGIEQYLERRKKQGSTAPDNKALGGEAAQATDRGATVAEVASENHNSAPRTTLSAQEDRELQKEMNAVERKMGKVSKELEKLQAKMAEVAERMASDASAADELTELDAKVREAQEQHEELEMRWLEIAEQREG